MAKEKTPTHIRVTAKVASFRRCGRVFGNDSIDIKVEDLQAGELDVLKAEPMLVVAEITETAGE